MKHPVNKKQIKVLLEMRPALEGFAGIPQECRLLFRGLRMLDDVDAEGMIQTSQRTLARGTPIRTKRFKKVTAAKRLNRYSRVIVSLAEKPYRTLIDEVYSYIEKRLAATSLSLRSLAGGGRIKLTQFESHNFTDFTWRTLFAKTLPASDFDLVSSADHRICSVPWHTMHMAGLKSMSVSPNPQYPRLATEGVDVFIAQTPYPASIDRKTAFVVRYHDAIPVLMPHTIPDKSLHQATHFYALSSNVKSGAYFACVSESTRQDLLRMFPEVADRAVTIYNMVSHHYFKEAAQAQRVPDIIRGRLYESDAVKGVELRPKFFSLREQEGFYRRVLNEKPLKYLLIVSTVEPRKNHTRLLAAWEVLKAEVDPDIKLVVVGTIGWDYMSIVKGFRSWIDRGELFMLNAVPAPDLRVLYRNAAATVCPSLGEGFDFSGVEAMRSDGVVIASDIPVHREVYEDAAEYFDPYSTATLVKALKNVLYASDAEQRQARLRERGHAVSERYLPENVLPKWQQFIENVASKPRPALTDANALPTPNQVRGAVDVR
ncbi:glycosyltransferase family 1 protein [Caballeronia sp. LZ035]|uniref:glycosyltransferase family 4 protein n=1 Tax=Caballeronia sp. LZ035 TaxID=3038568 RepID=UPI002867AF0E|nr:glycosyltransferase family 1 protein [Caballeronia sp. LZ035]MDR5757606.1 glycosyltransferase family 1 protein [Caballeronia sp. LZ035]